MITGKLFLLLVLNIVITLCSACRGDDEKHIDYSLFAESVDSRAEITDSSAVPDSERRQEGKAEMKGQEDNKEQAEQKEEPESWFSAIEFSGVRSEKTDYAIGNLGSNMKADSYVICYVCPDAANDAVYYVNLYGDNYIYRIKNGKRTLLSEVKAHNLQLWDNKLYFIKVDNEINPYSYNPGPLCSFDLISKEMKEVLDRNIISFFIDSYGIFFRELSDNNEVCMYKADFNHTVAKMEGCSWVLAYNEYLLTGKDDGISLVNRDTGEAVKLMTGMDDIANTLCISDDSLIFAKEAYIYLINLKTGEKSVYDANDFTGSATEDTCSQRFGMYRKRYIYSI